MDWHESYIIKQNLKYVYFNTFYLKIRSKNVSFNVNTLNKYDLYLPEVIFQYKVLSLFDFKI